jgi:hypothetical protein
MSLIYYDPLFNRSTGAKDANINRIISDSAIISTGEITKLTGSLLSYSNGTITALNATNGTITSLSGTTLTYPTANITTLQNCNSLNATNGTITSLSGTTLTYPTANITTLQNCNSLNATNGTITTLNGSSLNYSNGTISSLGSTNGEIATLNGSSLSYLNGDIPTLNSTTINATTINVPTIQTASAMNINAGGDMNIDCDSDNSTINIGVKSGQNKNINIGNQGTGLTTINTNMKIVKTSDATAYFTVSNTTGYGNRATINTSCSGGGALYIISNGQGTPYCGIPHGVSGICSYWGDMVLATGNGSTQSEKLRLSTTAITPSASIIPNTTGTYDIGSTTKYFNNGYITTLNTGLIQNNVGNLTIASSTGAIQISTDNNQGFVYIGTATTANKTLVIGSLYESSKTTIQSGTGGIVLSGKVFSDVIPMNNKVQSIGGVNNYWKEAFIDILHATTQSITTISVESITGQGAINLYSASGYDLTINTGKDMFIGNDTTISSIYLGNGSGNKTLTIGSTASGSTTTLQGGNGISFNGQVKSNIVPNGSWNIGSSLNYWTNGYITSLNSNSIYTTNLNLNGQTTFEPTLTKGNLTSSSPITITNGTGSVIGTGTSISMTQASATTAGWLSSSDWNTFNSKSGTITTGALSATTPLSFSGGGNVVGSATSLSMTQATATTDGWLSSTHFNIFNNKQNSLTFGNLTSSSPITITNGTGSVIGTGTSISMTQASATTAGWLSSVDWNTFNSKSGTIPTGALSATTPLSFSGGGSVVGSATSLSMTQASATTAGWLSSSDWNTFNSKSGTITTGALSATTPLSFSGGGSVVGSATSLSMTQASATTSGWLSSVDWNNFNSKSGTITTGALSATAPLSFSGGGSVVGSATSLSMTQSSTTTAGWLSSVDWNIFNNKFALPSGITFNSSGITSTGNFAISGSSLNMGNKVNIGNSASGTSYDLYINSNTGTSTIFNYSSKTSGTYAYMRNGAYGGGEIWIISNNSGSILYGITNGTSGISSVYGDMVLSANGTTQLEYLRLGKISSTSYIQCNQHTIPKTNNAFDLGSSSNKWNNGYITTLNSTTGNITTLQNCNSLSATTGNITTLNIATLNSTNASVSGQVSTGKVILSSGAFDTMEISGTTIKPLSSGLTIDATNASGVDIKGSNGLKINSKKIEFVVIPTNATQHTGPVQFKTSEYICVIAGTHPSSVSYYNGAKMCHSPNDPDWWYLETWGTISAMVMAIPIELCGADPYYAI